MNYPSCRRVPPPNFHWLICKNEHASCQCFYCHRVDTSSIAPGYHVGSACNIRWAAHCIWRDTVGSSDPSLAQSQSKKGCKRKRSIIYKRFGDSLGGLLALGFAWTVISLNQWLFTTAALGQILSLSALATRLLAAFLFLLMGSLMLLLPIL